jgi:hypothetical protein
MTMLLEPPSETMLRNTFERVLFGILNGSLPAAPECNGLDEQTRAVLNSLIGQQQRSRKSKIRAARTEFMRQLDGSHLRQGEAEWAALLMRHLPTGAAVGRPHLVIVAQRLGPTPHMQSGS